MFRGARLKLTTWYLLIIMFISISFSIVIYRVLLNEVERFTRIQRSRIERRLREGEFFPPEIHFRGTLPSVTIMDPELVEETKRRLILILITVNGGIFIISGGLGYFLAGRTLRPIKEMLDEQNRFVTDSSHELRTPLTSLKSAMEVALRDRQLSLTDAKTLISESIQEVDKLKSLSDELLQLSQYQKPNGYEKLEELSLSGIINNAVRRIEPMAQQKKIVIQDNIYDREIKGYKDQLVNLFAILLDNAIKYSPPKKSVQLTSKETDGLIAVHIKDHGIGISEDDLPHIFDRFYRVDHSRSKKTVSGFGLGLAIAKRIVELHKGIIEVTSRLGKGTTFIVKLHTGKHFG